METKERSADRTGALEERSVRMPGNRVVTTKVAAERTGWAYSLFEVEVGVGGAEGPHVQHREDEWLYVLEGQFGLAVEGVASEAGPGTHAYLPRGALHAYENAGDRTGRLLVVHTPGGAGELPGGDRRAGRRPGGSSGPRPARVRPHRGGARHRDMRGNGENGEELLR